MQYNQDELGARTRLPKQNVDTGMGLERAAGAAEGIGGVQYDGGESHTDYALRVLGDHARAMTFLVLDGVIPGNTGREYVLRRIVRRAILYGRRQSIDRPFLPDL